MGKATQKQMDYAKAIAKELGIQEPKDSFEDCQLFISTHVYEYKNKRQNIVYDLVNSGHPMYQDFVNEFGEKSILWMEKNLKKVAGVYAFLGIRNKLLYIGKSKDLASRIPSSWAERKRQADIKKVLYFPTPTEADASVLEMFLITDKKPLLNVDGKTKDKPKMFNCCINIKKDFMEIPIKKEISGHGRKKNVCKNDHRQ